MRRLVVVGLVLALVPLIWAATSKTTLGGRVVVRSPMELFQTIVASARGVIARRRALPREATDGWSRGSGLAQLKEPTLPTITPAPTPRKAAPVVTPTKVVRTVKTRSRNLRRLPPGYLITFGHFPNLAVAEPVARRVRAKGYIAKVVSSGGACTVMGHTYRYAKRGRKHGADPASDWPPSQSGCDERAIDGVIAEISKLLRVEFSNVQ